MNKRTIIIAEKVEVVATLIRKDLEAINGTALTIKDPSAFDAVTRLHPEVRLALVDVGLMDATTGRERPFWQTLATRPYLPLHILCFTDSRSAASDTPLFTPPTGTVTAASPAHFKKLAATIEAYLQLYERNPLLFEALTGQYMPSLRGNFQEWRAESILTLLNMGGNSGVLLVRDGVTLGLIGLKKGEIVHALAGTTGGKEAFCTMVLWRNAQFAFFPDVQLEGPRIQENIVNLMLEANRSDDEVSEVARDITPQTHLQRVKRFGEELLGHRLLMAEWTVLNLVERYPRVSDLMSAAASSHVRLTNVQVMKAIRSLQNAQLIEINETELGTFSYERAHSIS
jgi:Domain of unknown function (DUF4388)